MSGFIWDPGIICPTDPTATAGRIKQYAEYYRVKYEIALEAAPETILEIGVRAGYSAWAFFQAAPGALYVGIDANNGRHGGKGGEDLSFFKWAARILSPYRTMLVHADTRRTATLPFEKGGFGLIHVDGDHSAAGVTNDLELCRPLLAPGGVLLVDDVDYIPGVRRGLSRWLEGRPEARVEYRKSLRGEALIRI